MSRPVLIRALIAIPALLIAGVIFVFFSWFYTVTQLRIASRWGVFPSAEEGMRALAAQSYRGIQSINILYAGPNSKDGGFPYVWFVIAEVRARQRAGEAAPAGRQICDVPGSFFPAHQGWLGARLGGRFPRSDRHLDERLRVGRSRAAYSGGEMGAGPACEVLPFRLRVGIRLVYRGTAGTLRAHRILTDRHSAFHHSIGIGLVQPDDDPAVVLDIRLVAHPGDCVLF